MFDLHLVTYINGTHANINVYIHICAGEIFFEKKKKLKVIIHMATVVFCSSCVGGVTDQILNCVFVSISNSIARYTSWEFDARDYNR